jgi:type I restriction enzyme S subunit
MKKYDNYKDSGIEWIGEIPEHWDRIRIKSLVAIKVTDGPHETPQWIENGVPFISAEAIKGNRIDLDFKRGYISTEQHLEYCKKSKVLKNDILFCKSGSTTGKSALVDTDVDFGIWSPLAIIRADKNKIDYKYLFQSIQSSLFQNQVETAWTFGTQPNIGMGALENLWIAIPTLEEQKSIANYLDHKTTQIDHLIAKKEQFITLLQEERTAVINQAVTKGLDPKVKMKDSDIEWLGEIPEHWEVKRLKHLVKIPLKYGANESAEDEILEDPRYIRITDFGNDGKLRKNTFKSLSFEKAENFLLEEGDILFARSGATVGKTFFFKDFQGVACFAGYLIKATCNPTIMKAEFLYEFTNSSGYENWKQSIFQQSTIQNIGADKYNQLKIGVPPLIEQQGIIDFISKKTDEINILISKGQQEIELLKEYKTALISEAVTGKVDVREEVLN